MKKIDCFLIGHNEISIDRNKRMLFYLYGKDSHEYRDRIKYNLSQLSLNNKRYSPVEFFNYIRQGIPTDPSGNLSIITESFNLAIAYLGNYLNKNGLSFDFINSFNDEKEVLREKLLNDEIRTIGINTTYYLSHQPIHEIIAFARKNNPHVKIIVGGPYVINKAKSMPEQKLTELFRIIGADYFVNDPSGEDILVDIIRSIREHADPSSIRNLYYLEGETFKFSYNKIEDYDFAKNQIDWHLFKDRLAPIINLRTAVSCPYKCAFCNYPSYAGKYLLSEIDYCEKELNLLKALEVRHIQFVDDTFNVPQDRFKELLRMMIKNEFRFQWNSYFKCQYADEETVELMKESGCQYVFLGIESGCQLILDNMNKKNKVEIYRECIDLFNKYDIMTMCSIVVGYPGETEGTFAETISFIEEACPTFYQQRLWWYDQTAPVNLQRKNFHLKGDGYSWKHMTMNSEEAHRLADYMFLNIRNSIHITEYALPFFLLERGLSKECVIEFLKHYMYINRDQYMNINQESDPNLVEGMLRSVKGPVVNTLV